MLPIGYTYGFLYQLSLFTLCTRTRLLDRLERDKRYPDDDMRIITSYNKLKNVNIVKPTLKKYLNSKVRSRFRRIDSEDFLTALMLPVQRFKKSSASRVWSDSRKII